MGRELKFMTCAPDDTYYTWQVHLWLESLKKLNKSKDAIVLLFVPKGRTHNYSKWKVIIDLYPEAEFTFYFDTKNEISTTYIPIYIPILRPYMMHKYFTENTGMVDKAIFYCDSDILFMDSFNVEKFKDDDINYLSDTNSYINIEYFDNKWKDVLPDKQEEFKKLDIVSMMGSLIGITRQDAERFKNDSGGAQYLLKNLNADFWMKVMKDCIIIRKYLQKLNNDFFENENKGYQSWCADMWAVLWNIWYFNGETKVIEEMNFAWATDPIERLKHAPILHNAGITGPQIGTPENGYPAFYKGMYHKGTDPTIDPHLEKVISSEKSKKHCTWYYANAIKELKEKYKVNY
jgi:hypothetical protein